MGNKKWTRLVALCLAVVCTLSVVLAADLQFDMNKDGKTTVWDLQNVLKNNSANYEKAVREALGNKGDELRPNSDGAYEIWSDLGWRNFVKNADEGMSFELMTDIDLKGANWTPIAFSGNFNGNGHSISNVEITKDAANGSSRVMGFFSTIYQYDKDGEKTQSVVDNLHLKNVNLVAGENTDYMGLLAGSSKGIIRNCTATGSVTDNRTELAKNVYVGAIVGCNENSTPAGKLEKGTNLLTVGNGDDDQKVPGVSAVLATKYAAATGDGTRNTGIAGYSKDANLDDGMLWQDASNSTAYATADEQRRRNTVEQEMFNMGSVEWTPSENITFTRFNKPTLSHSNAFVAGKDYTYIGIPYVGAKDGNYTRFLSQMQAAKDSSNRYVTVKGLKDGTQTNIGTDEIPNYVYDGFVTMMGSNCTWAAMWSWATVSPLMVKNDSKDIYGGVAADSLLELIPTAAHTDTYGVLPVGNYTVADGTVYTDAIVTANGKQTMAECYAQASKGDVIISRVVMSYGADGHTRMLADDPVIIRKGASGTSKNTIDLEKSYVLIHGQGDGLSDASTETHTTGLGTYTIKFSSWWLNHKCTLEALLTKDGRDAADAAATTTAEKPGNYWGYVPVTMRAFTWDASLETSKAPYYSTTGNQPITLPNGGIYYSNYRNVSVTMKIVNNDTGVTVYENTDYFDTTAAAASFGVINLGEMFPDVPSLTEGTTYVYTLAIKASNGKVYYPKIDGKYGTGSVLKDYEFTYYAS